MLCTIPRVCSLVISTVEWRPTCIHSSLLITIRQWRPTSRQDSRSRYADISSLVFKDLEESSSYWETHQTVAGEEKEEEEGEDDSLETLDKCLDTPSSCVKGMFSCPKECALPCSSVEHLAIILRRCRRDRDGVLVLRVYAHMQKNGMAAHRILGNYLVLTLNEVGNTYMAEQVFDHLVHWTEQSLSSLISAHVNSRNPLKALALHEKLREDSSAVSGRHTMVSLLRACAKLQDVEKGSALHAELARGGLIEMDAFIGSALVDMYAKCGLLMIAQEVFDYLPVRDVVSWNSLITGLSKHGCGDKAFSYYERMVRDGFPPTSVTFLSTLKACSSIGATEKGQIIHTKIESMGWLEENVDLGNTLVDMYAKCGLLLDAQDIFDRLQVRDVVSWNALMTGFVEHNHDEEALECFELMQQDGVFPDAVTFVCILKACGNSEAIHKGRDIHAEADRRGLPMTDPVVGNALIDMYANCGLPFLAQQVLNRLPVKNAITWNTLITGYSKHDRHEEALECFKKMQMDANVSPDTATFVSSLKAAGSIGTINCILDIHAEVGRKGLLDTDPLIGSTLVDAYGKCCALSKAQEVFDKLPTRGVVSWTALISGYAEHGQAEKALEGLARLRLDGFVPDAVTYVCSLKACGNIKALEKGQAIHTEIEHNGLLERDLVVASTLVDMYARCGMLAKAQEVFDKLSVQDVVAWNALILGYIEQGNGEEAIKVYERMCSEGVSASNVTFVGIFKACGSIGALGTAQQLHADISRIQLLRNDLSIGNSLVDMYVKFGLVAKARDVFDRLPSRDMVSWNTLLTGYAEHGHSEEAVQCFEQMQLYGIPPNFITLVCCLKACGSMGAIERGYEIHAEIERTGLLERESAVGTALVDMYAKCGMVVKAQEVFNKLSVKDVITWTALIAGYAEEGLAEDALNSLDQMQCDGHYPDGFTLVWSLKACSSIGATEKGQHLQAEIERKGLLEKDAVIGNSLLDMYVKCGTLGKAQQLFDKLPWRDLVSWNSLLVGYTQLGESECAFSVFDRMLGEGFRPDSVTFTIVLNACSRMGRFDKGKNYFEAMTRDFGMVPSVEHHTCMVDGLCRSGHLHQAMSVIKNLSISADLAVWHAFLSSCFKWGNFDFGRKAFKQAIHLDEQHATAYVFMSKLYMDRDRVKTAEKRKPNKAPYWTTNSVESILWGSEVPLRGDGGYANILDTIDGT